MTNAVSRAINGVLGRAVPERQLFIRSESRTRVVCLTPLTQIGAAALVAGGLGWTGYASASFVARAVEADAMQGRVAAMAEARAAERAAHRAERAALAEARDRLVRETAELEAALGAEKRELIALRTALDEARAELAAMRGRTAELDAERRAAEARADELESAMFAPEPAAEGIETGAAGPRVEKLADVSGAIDAVIAERDVAREIADELGARLDTAKARLADWRQREEELLSRIEEAARTSLAGMSELFERAELDLDSILAETRRDFTGRGGPFRPLAVAPVAGPEEEPRIAALLDDLERVQLMRLAAERLPFTAPVTGVRLTSGFGKRRDPFSKRWAMHEGLDYAGPVGTPIRAAAAGRVVHAGWMGGYGKVVTIRHAFGYETRYAHLSRIDVTRGERVAAGDRIGSMGSTGRSTGSHLHYEVRANDRPVNPAKFIEAARNVL